MADCEYQKSRGVNVDGRGVGHLEIDSNILQVLMLVSC